ncbi:MAG: LysM peptidoglycan-binding domain-containing protein [Clostridiales bacterium]|nr:LysM peptidoglycan-binding domain-containing protein [Clostridiales bacterium]
MNYQNCNGIIYVIKPGDTLYKISQRYGIPTAKLLRANPNMNIYNLRIGDKICIPTGGNVTLDQIPEQTNYYTVGESESIKTVMERTNMKFAELVSLNPLNTLILKPGSEIVTKTEVNDQ